MVNLFQLVNELRDIAAQADKKRLSVWVTQFEVEFPDLADEICYCAQMDSPKTVLAYLRERDQRFALLALIPNIEPVIQFLMGFINERGNGDSSNHPDVGNAVGHATIYRTRRTSTHA
jgi:hypothetical protein